eukprot:c25683_g1_i1.p1 GENE.c25683_g1_i1~~c25683_g1_i1.p1  ORF type:complete len:236 (-),score=42.35 c25683_g1_i1:68-775(-)
MLSSVVSFQNGASQGAAGLEMQSFQYGETGGFTTPIGATPAGTYQSSRAFPPVFESGADEFANDLPLLEELGINFRDIRDKSLAVLHPLKQDSEKLSHIMDSYDLAGPIVIALALGVCMMLGGKISFGYIYGVGSVGCCCVYMLLNLMCERGVDIYRAASVLGYCLLPMVFLAALAPLIDLRSLTGMAVGGLCILWCTHSAAAMFAAALDMREQRWLLFYALFLYYAIFGVLAVF